MKKSVLMVCMGNICRSPTAEGVLRHKLRAAGLADVVEVDSAGTHDWHAGKPADQRSVSHALRRGYDLSLIRSRPVAAEDFEHFDLILAMDWDNLALLQQACPAAHQRKLRRLSEFALVSTSPVVPDPYQGGPEGFDQVLDLVEDACDGVVLFLSRTKNMQSGGTS